MLIENTLNGVRRMAISESIKFMWLGFAIAVFEKQGTPIEKTAAEFLEATGLGSQFGVAGLIAAYYRSQQDFKILRTVLNEKDDGIN